MSFQLTKLQTDVLVGRKALPEKEKVERELVNAQISLKECERQLRTLEAAVENANDPSRLRILPGDSPSRNELTDRIEKLEVSVSLTRKVAGLLSHLKAPSHSLALPPPIFPPPLSPLPLLLSLLILSLSLFRFSLVTVSSTC